MNSFTSIHSFLNNNNNNNTIIVDTNPPIDKLSTETKNIFLTSSGGAAKSAGAYGTKLLYSTYTGPVMTIRRSSDSSTVDFYADINGNLGMTVGGSGTSFSSWITTDTAYVTKWWDQTGNQNHGIQNTTTLQPIYESSSSILNFIGTKYFALPNGTLPYGSTPYTVVIKHSVYTTASYGTMLGGGYVLQSSTYNNQYLGFMYLYGSPTSAYYNYWFNNDYNSGNFTNPATTNTVVTFKNPSSGIRNVYVNGTQTPSGTYTTGSTTSRNNDNTNNYIGNGFSGTPLNAPFGGKIQYIYIVPIGLSDTDRNILEST